jgi:hypothetical protein
MMKEHIWRVLENRAFSRIFGPRMEKMEGGSRGLHKEELLNLYASRNIIRVIKSRRMRCERHVTRMGEMRNTRT